MNGADRRAGRAADVGIAGVLAAASSRSPKAPALIGPWGSRTWSGLDAAATAGARRLAEVVVAPAAPPAPSASGAAPVRAARVVIALPTGPELAAALMATFRAGLIAVPVDPDHSDVPWVAKRVAAAVVIGDAAAAPGPVVGGDEAGAWWNAAPESPSSEPVIDGEDLAILARASRSGPPVMLSHRAILAAARAVAAAPPLSLRPADRVLQVLPLFHVVGLVTAFLPAALAGAAVVVPDAADPKGRAHAAIVAVRTHRVSVLPAEPTLYRQLDRVAGFERALGTVRLMTSGSSPLDPVDFAAMRSATGQAVREGYGISEAAGAITSTLLAAVGRPGSSGLPYPGVDLRIDGGDDDRSGAEHGPDAGDDTPPVDDGAPAPGAAQEPAVSSDGSGHAANAAPASETADDSGASVAASQPGPGPRGDASPVWEGITDLVDVDGPGGEVGRISIRGDTLFSGYWPDGAGAPDDDGWFATGDIGYLDDAGELHLVDRAGETITVAGFTVYPREVEDVLAGHPLVADVAVVALPGRGGETVVAALVARPGTRPTADDVTEFVAASGLAPFKRPTDYRVVSVLPRTEVGRLDRETVRRDFARARGIDLGGEDEGADDGRHARAGRPTPLRRRLPGVGRVRGGRQRGSDDTDADLF